MKKGFTRSGTEWTAERRETFLTTLANGLSVTAACNLSCMSRSWMYKQRELDPSFATEWDQAVEAGTDGLEDEAVRRAKSQSDLLMIFMLKGRRPEKFRDNSSVSVSGNLSFGDLVKASMAPEKGKE